MQQTHGKNFDWTAELHQTMVQSLTTTFGLDFLLIKDKTGGDVDTIHNARQGIYATEKEQQAYANKGDYNSHEYHTHKDYIAKGRADKQSQQTGDLKDSYTNQTLRKEHNRQLDHTISAHEIHHDGGRVLAGLDGVTLANQDSNLNSTHGYINNLKSNHSAEKFINEIAPKKRKELTQQIAQDKAKLNTLPTQTPQQRHEKRELEAKIRKNTEKVEALDNTLKNKELLLKADKEAREKYNGQINKAYYTSSKFFKGTLTAAANTGFKMGLRQALGLILAEIWFELNEQFPKILNDVKHNFKLENFINEVQKTLKNIWMRVSSRFSDMLISFQDGVIGGIFSNVTTTIINIFFTTQKLVGKLIRETWSSIVQAAKLIFFNPENLTLGQLAREITRIIGTGVSVVLGVVLNHSLNTLIATIPFGVEIAAFISAMATGVLIMGVTYFMDYSPTMQKLWKFLDGLKDKYKSVLEHYQQINAELDRYLLELSKIEFNMNPDELDSFAFSLSMANDEASRTKVIDAEVKRRGIELPFESGNAQSIRDWLSSL